MYLEKQEIPLSANHLNQTTPLPVHTSGTISFDNILRITVSTDDAIALHHLGTTEQFLSWGTGIMASLDNSVSVLSEVVISQKRLIDYNAVFNAYLMGHLTEEEFENESDDFSYTPATIDQKKLENKICLLIDSTGIEFSSFEIADIFQCNEEDAQESLNRIAPSVPSKVAEINSL